MTETNEHYRLCRGFCVRWGKCRLRKPELCKTLPQILKVRAIVARDEKRLLKRLLKG